MSEYNVKNYTEQGGEVTHIGGELVFDDAGNRGIIPNQEASTAGSYTALKDDFNALILKLKDCGLMVSDAWSTSVLAVPTPAAMPTENTAYNSGKATVSIDGTDITITLSVPVSELKDANHGETWGKHKWLGFGVRTGLAAITGVKFTDDTGASATLGADDVAEATALGLSAGDFVLYIKAEDAAYLSGGKSFTLGYTGYKTPTYTMTIVEPDEE